MTGGQHVIHVYPLPPPPSTFIAESNILVNQFSKKEWNWLILLLLLLKEIDLKSSIILFFLWYFLTKRTIGRYVPSFRYMEFCERFYTLHEIKSLNIIETEIQELSYGLEFLFRTKLFYSRRISPNRFPDAKFIALIMLCDHPLWISETGYSHKSYQATTVNLVFFLGLSLTSN